MQGRVTKFFDELGVGVISTGDGRKFRFRSNDVLNRHLPIDDQEVDFLISGRTPVEIIVLAGSPWTAFGSIETN